MTAPRRRLLHFLPDRTYPFRTLCGAGRSGSGARGWARWRPVDATPDAAAVTCPRCTAQLRKAGGGQ